MKKKTVIVISSLALLAGVAIGGVALNSASADELETAERPFTRQLSEEKREQMRQNHQEMQTLEGNIDREVVKTDSGIQINLQGQDEETIAKMHELYDENGGQWGKWGPMGGGMGKHLRNGDGFIDANGNGICDHAE